MASLVDDMEGFEHDMMDLGSEPSSSRSPPPPSRISATVSSSPNANSTVGALPRPLPPPAIPQAPPTLSSASGTDAPPPPPFGSLTPPSVASISWLGSGAPIVESPASLVQDMDAQPTISFISTPTVPPPEPVQPAVSASYFFQRPQPPQAYQQTGHYEPESYQQGPIQGAAQPSVQSQTQVTLPAAVPATAQLTCQSQAGYRPSPAVGAAKPGSPAPNICAMQLVPRCEVVNWAVTGIEKERSRDMSRDEESGLGLLGFDQLLAILQHLPVQALMSFGMTCKRYREMADTDALWTLICKREWGSRAVEAWPSAGRHNMRWKRLYRQMLLLNAAAWHRVQQGDTVPPPRASPSMNVVNGVVTVFGGGCNGGRHLDDSWVAAVPEYPAQGLNWQQMMGVGPSGRFGQSCITVGNVLMLYGGINDKGTRLGDTWICQGLLTEENEGMPMWELLDVAAAPPPRGAHGGCFAGDRKVVIFGGIASDGTRLGDTWMLDLAETPLRWTEVVTPFSPRPRSGHTLTWVGGKRIILFGGRGVDFEVMNDVWLLDLESDYPSWVELEASEPHPERDHPAPRAGHSATLIFGGRILIFGGEDSKRGRKGDVWVLDPSAGFQVTHNAPCLGTYPRHRGCANSSASRFSKRFWKKLKQFGRPPSKRSFHAACAIDSGHVVLVFGGMVDSGITPTASAGVGFDGEFHMLQLVP